MSEPYDHSLTPHMASVTSIDLGVQTSRFRVLGVSVDAVQIPEVIGLLGALDCGALGMPLRRFHGDARY